MQVNGENSNLCDKIASARISVDSGTNETYASVKRNPNCDRVWENIHRYAATGGDFVVKYIILSMNSDIEEVDTFVNRCRKAGVRSICISVDARPIYYTMTAPFVGRRFPGTHFTNQPSGGL